jgi:hypothetical protein
LKTNLNAPQQTRRVLYNRYSTCSNPSLCTMGRPKHRKLINIQNINGGSDTSPSKQRKTTGNSDLEAMGKENVHFTLPITEFSPYKLDSGIPWHGTRKSPYGKNAVNVPMHQ